MLVTNGEPGRLLDIIKAQGEIAAGDLDQHQAMQIIVNRVPELIGADGALIAAPAGSGAEASPPSERRPRHADSSRSSGAHQGGFLECPRCSAACVAAPLSRLDHKPARKVSNLACSCGIHTPFA